MLVSPTRGRIQVSEWRPEGWEARATASTLSILGASAGVGGGGGGEADPPEPPPALIYIHGNAGGRLDVVYNGVLELAASRGWCLIAFDCCGSGLSDGNQVKP